MDDNEPDSTTDESRYESTVDVLTDADDSEEYSPSYDSDSESPPPPRPDATNRKSARNIKPPPIFTYNKLGGEPSLCHKAARSKK